ncbi:MAG: hypothetical protein HY293_05895 [Planctomycetes bacterium]|nr:hypothetical protein [Planctomycetota bacterium]
MKNGGASVLEIQPWLWPVAAPPRIREGAWSLAGLADPCSRGFRGAAAAVVLGALPLLLSAATGVPGHAALSAAGLLLLSLACVRRDAGQEGIAFILLAFLAHGVAAVAIAHVDPVAAARVMPGAEEYWKKQLLWIRTGWDPEYETSAWLPAHVGQLGGGILTSYVSLGWITFFEGFREVDWMNFYSARLMDSSRSPALALLLGWHAWSLLRGLGFGVLSFEVLSLSLGRLTGRRFSTPARRRNRWTAALLLLGADGLVKFLALQAVQRGLLENLR